MTEQQLTDFQLTSERQIGTALEKVGLTIDQREVLTGKIPFYSKEPQTTVHITANGLQVWLWSDEAHLVHNGSESRFEQPDFDSIDKLREALLTEIQSRLAEPRK
jgi:hypothetical protein